MIRQMAPGIWSAPIQVRSGAIPILHRTAREDTSAAPARGRRIAELEEQVNGGLLRRWRDPDLIKRARKSRMVPRAKKLLSLLTKSHADRSADDEKFISSQAEKLGVDLGASRPGIPNFPTPSLLLNASGAD